MESLSPDLLDCLLPGSRGETPVDGKVFMERHGRKIIRVNLDVCLKIYPPEQNRAQAVWQKALFLEDKSIATPPPLFWGLHKSGYGVYASKWLQGVTSWPLYLHHLPQKDRRDFLSQLADFLNRLHQRGVYHRDLSHWNILVDQKGKLWLVDLDEMKLLSKVSFRRRFRNLVQVFCSALEVCSVEERGQLWSLYWQKKKRFFFCLIEWFARRRQKHIAQKYRKKYCKKYSALG